MRLTTVLGLCVLLWGDVYAAQYVFPENGQSAEQQGQDEYYCHNWSTQQTGYDPTVIAQQTPSAEPSRSRSGARGALRGAGRGWVIGEVADGDSGDAALAGAVLGGLKGRRDSRNEQEQQSQQISSAQQGKQADYFRARAACLEAKGYSVK
ncbi:MAG: hypothetical protein GQ547_05720 [Methylophaga sp.]|nr:hypothetical protein [Methylophaga sp.]